MIVHRQPARFVFSRQIIGWLLAPIAFGLSGACVSASAGGLALGSETRREAADPVERALIDAHPQLLNREGDTLSAAGVTLVDQGDCADGDCVRYRADGVWKGEFVGVEVNYYEESDYLLVLSGYSIEIGSRPIPSPAGTLFFTGHHDDRRWSPYQGASVWAWSPHPRRLRVVDTDLVAFERFVGWHGDSCVEFVGARGYNVTDLPLQAFWLAEEDGDWRVFDKRPEVCA